ncbi:hypothetical protein QL093DRAFT_2575440 [Fusarium oxysporum]|nr:hypothetical protein QL093DRAFT_2575440 [Fusarium oxysporum]
MAPNQSNLSDPKYGYDFVVATTQESINAGLVQYLMNIARKQKYTYRFFLRYKNPDPTVEMDLDQLLDMSGGINPFDIPTNTDWQDQRLQKMRDIGLVCSIRIRPGIPPGCIVRVPDRGPQIRLPEPIITFGETAKDTIFNMYCSDVTVIKNNIPTKVEEMGSWVWYSQLPGDPWYFQTQTDLVTSELDKNLNTPYFASNTEERDALKLKLENISGTAFSLQQLLFNLQEAIPQGSSSRFFGLADETALQLLKKSFTRIWSIFAKDHGEPVIGVTAVAQEPSASPLQVTALERWISPVVHARSPEDLKATTLNYLCAINGNQLPGPQSFSWNWIEPKDVSQSSGVTSIKRNTIAQYLLDKILPQARKSCIQTIASVDADGSSGQLQWVFGFRPGQEPTLAFKDAGPIVASLYYSYTARSWGETPNEYGQLILNSTYSCSVVLGDYKWDQSLPLYYKGGNTFTIIQRLLVMVEVLQGRSGAKQTGAKAMVVDKVLTDEYVISVDQNGGLTSSPTTNSTSTDKSQQINAGSVTGSFNVQELLQKVKDSSSEFANAQLQSIPFNNMQSFVFPGAKVFSFNDASFSDSSDLCCLITYVNPTDKSEGRKGSEASSPPKVIQLNEVPRLAAYVLKLLDEEHGGEVEKRMAESLGLANDVSAVSNATGTIYNSQDRENGPEIEGMLTRTKDDVYLKPSVAEEREVVTSSTEMMLNYVQGKVVEPEGKFRALQAANGTALLFSIDSSGVFNVIEETVAEIQTGWRATDLSSKTIDNRFPSGAKVRQFDIGQSVMNENTISLAMSVRSDGSDTLFLSLINSHSSTSEWIPNCSWTSFPFDAQDGPSSIHITDIYISETDQQQQYIMVDILRDPNSELKATSRYVVDPFSPSEPHWMPHILPFEVEEGTYQSCVGRVPDAFVDGIYTAGAVKGVPQCSYVPFFNPSGSAAPMPTRLPLPDKLVATAIASARYEDESSPWYGTTDFYAVGNSTIYRWNPDEQLDDNTVGTALLTNPVFAGTDTLITLMHNKITTIFGKNASNIVYYTSCHIDYLADPMSWSAPVPVLRGIERITSFINLKDGGNTVFAAGGSQIQKLTQATHTKSKLWCAQPIMLEASPQSSSISFNSYTTTIKVRGQNGNLLMEREIVLTTEARTPVYIDGLYYILSTTPVTIPVDASGQVIIIQATASIIGAIINVRLGLTEHIVDPMAISFNKMAKLSDKEALKNAQIRTNTVAGGVTGHSGTDKLVLSSVSDSDLETTVKNMKLLTDTYNKNRSRASQLSLGMVAPATTRMVVSQGSGRSGFVDCIAIAIGDLFNWLKTGVEKVVDFAKETATGLWQFIVSVGSDVYAAVLDTVDAVVGAVEWVFDQIKTGVNKVLRYLEFLFDWDDIRRTKQVTHNLVRYHLTEMVSDIKTAKGEFDECMDEAQKAVAEWSGIKDWSGLGDAASKPPSGQMVDTTTEQQTPSSQMMMGHLKNQVGQITTQGAMPEPSQVQGLVDDMIAALEAEGAVFLRTYEQLQDLAKGFTTLSLADILKRLVGILVEGVLGTTKVVVDAILDVLHRLAGTVFEILDTKIHIPIISEILRITIIHKIATGEALFADNATTRSLIDAKDWASFSAVVNQPIRLASDEKHTGNSHLGVSRDIGRTIHIVGHALAGFMTFPGTFVIFNEAVHPDPKNPYRIPSSILGIVGAVALGAADYLSAAMPIDNTFISILRKVTAGVTVLFKCIFSGPAQNYFNNKNLKFLQAADTRKIAAVFDMVVVAPNFFCIFYHFDEIREKPVSTDRTIAIVEETARMMTCFARVSYTVAVLAPNPVAKVVAATSMYNEKENISLLSNASRDKVDRTNYNLSNYKIIHYYTWYWPSARTEN